MDSWKPLQPNSRHVPSIQDAYAAPAQSTRQAPPAHPHPPAASRPSVPGSKRASLFSWSGRGNASKYAAPPVDASSSLPGIGSGSKWASAARRRSGTDRAMAEGDETLIGNLPAPIHAMIADLLNLQDVANYMLSCRKIAYIIAKEDFWHRRAIAVQWAHVEGVEVESAGVQTTISPSPSSATQINGQTRAESQTLAEDEEWTDFSSAKMTVAASGDSFRRLSFSTVGSVPASSTNAVFSFSNEVSLPSGRLSPSYCAVRSYKIALRPILESLEASESADASTLFTTATWGPLEQQALLGNLIRAVLPASSGGGGLFPMFNTPQTDPQLLGTASSRASLLLSSTSQLTSQLLSHFTSSCDRRSDALRAAEHGATGIAGAVNRAEGDMRAFAAAVWELGRSAQRLVECSESLGRATEENDDAVEGNSHSTRPRKELGAEAKTAWLETQDKKNPVRWSTEPSANIISSPTGPATLDFTPMIETMSAVSAHMLAEARLIAQIFPPEQKVLLEWGHRIAHRLVEEYIRPLLELAKRSSIHLFLRSCAATFTQSLRLVEALLETSIPYQLPAPSTTHENDTTSAARQRQESDAWKARFDKVVTRDACYATVYQAWEFVMTDYLVEEKEWIRTEMERVAYKWEEDLANQAAASRVDAAFLTAQNPAAVKRTVLSGFKDVLLLPVTVVPRTAVNVGGAVFRTAGKGVSHLNPLKWQGSAANETNQTESGSAASPSGENGYIDFSNGGLDVHQYGSEDEDDDEPGNLDERLGSPDNDEWNEEVKAWKEVANKATREAKQYSVSTGPQPRIGTSTLRASSAHSRAASATSQAIALPSTGQPNSRPATPRSATPTPVLATPSSLQRMQLLLSLDTALQMIHLNRDCLKRIGTFSAFPGEIGSRVQEEIEDVAVAFLQCLGERHINPGFQKATSQIISWAPAEQSRKADARSGTATTADEGLEHVEPLVHFFELVHVGDTIAQMVQVYFDQELSRHIDRGDFFNSVVREKKRFENALDEAVAAGLNAGVDLLMGQVEHIVATTQDPRDYYPEKSSDMDLGRPTAACAKAIQCLQTHCKMLVGCTDKNVLEVFWQEIGLRLHTIICKHLKRQIISLEGGFKVIADLNAYYAFIASLKQSTLLPYFEALKMLGNVYVIEDPKELASLVRDTTVFRGTLTPEDLYEFLQARCDFKAIEKAVDKEMYGFKVSEDCKVM